MDKFYVVGISTKARPGEHISQRVHGDAMVYAPDKNRALTMVRGTGWIPNPGDIYLFGGEGYNKYMGDVLDSAEVELAKEKARDEGVAIIWSSDKY